LNEQEARNRFERARSDCLVVLVFFFPRLAFAGNAVEANQRILAYSRNHLLPSDELD
jgi:hypothetical protein